MRSVYAQQTRQTRRVQRPPLSLYQEDRDEQALYQTIEQLLLGAGLRKKEFDIVSDYRYGFTVVIVKKTSRGHITLRWKEHTDDLTYELSFSGGLFDDQWHKLHHDIKNIKDAMDEIDRLFD